MLGSPGYCSISLLSCRVDSSGQVMFNHQLQIRYRALDLLAEWIDGYYFYDFKTNLDLVKELLVFVRDEVIGETSFRILVAEQPRDWMWKLTDSMAKLLKH